MEEAVVPAEVQRLVDERENARKNKDFAKSDELRDKIRSLGFEIEDGGSGSVITELQH